MANSIFRFTHWLDTFDACVDWFNHFKKKGIATAIVSSKSPISGKVTFAVFREGVESGIVKKSILSAGGGYGKTGRFKVEPTIMASSDGWDKDINIGGQEEKG